MMSIEAIKLFNERIKSSTYFQLFFASFFCLFSLLIFGILLSYHPLDESFFYASTELKSIYNWFGTFGGHCAALLFFFFGGVAILFSPFFIFVAFKILAGRCKADSDQFIGWFICILSWTGLCNYYGTDLFDYSLPGGYLGVKFNSFLYYFFDSTTIHLFLLLSLFISFILLSHMSLVFIGVIALKGIKRLCDRERTIKPMLLFLKRVANKIVCCIKHSASYVVAVISGKEIQEHESVVIFEEVVEQSWFEEHSADEQFWAHLFNEEVLETPRKNTDKMQLQSVPQKLQKPAKEKDAFLREPQYALPDMNIFEPVAIKTLKEESESFQQLAGILEGKLERFGIKGKVTSIKIGPVITLFEYEPHIDSKISKIIALEDDLALALQAVSIRIIAPIPGRSVVGFEVANKARKDVLLSNAIHSKEFQKFKGSLPLILGEDVVGSTVIIDLARTPHLLVAGSTGSGKSVALNTMLISLLYAHNPDNLKLILIDPKRLEFSAYSDIAHLIFPIVTDPKKAAPVLKWVVKTMEERYCMMEATNVRNIFDYHELQKQDSDLEKMPFLVVMIDELSDLMMTAGKEIEDLIARITQMARAAGIHMIVATQRPSVDVITGLIKVNFPSRISFKVISKIDSRTILDCGGADKLLGKGDMLYLNSSSQLERVHGAYVSMKEIEGVINHIRAQAPTQYLDLQEVIATAGATNVDESEEHLYQDILAFLETVDEVSISLLQRKFRIGYNRAARIIETLEGQGVIMQDPNGKTRRVVR